MFKHLAPGVDRIEAERKLLVRPEAKRRPSKDGSSTY